MSVRKILGCLEEDDLRRYRHVAALAQLAMSGNSNISVDEGVRHLAAHWKMFGEMRKKHDILEDEAVDISLYDGAIIEVEED